jgi:hypothetical protein
VVPEFHALIVSASIVQTAINWWDLVPAVVGGILGALAGGIPAYFLSKSASREISARDKVARESIERLAMLRLYLALSQVGNDVLSARQQIDEMAMRPVSEDDKFPSQRRLSAFSGMQSVVANPFLDLDLSPLASQNGIELINQLDLLGRCYIAQVAILNDFRIHKERLFELYEQSEDAQIGGPETITFKLNHQQFATKLKIRESTAETVANGAIEVIRRNSRLVYRAIKTYNAAASSFLVNLHLPLIDQVMAVQKFPDLLNDDDQPRS